MSAAGEAFVAQVDEATHAAADAVASAADLIGVAARGATAPVVAAAEIETVEESGSGLAPEKPALLYGARPADADDLQRIRGVGPKLEAMLNGMGVYTLAQIAGFSEGNLAWIDSNLTAFRGRPLRDDWVAQARALL
jgi:NADH-quinone oxidoreductase subunit E